MYFSAAIAFGTAICQGGCAASHTPVMLIEHAYFFPGGGDFKSVFYLNNKFALYFCSLQMSKWN